MNRLFLLLLLFVVAPSALRAQKFIVDPIFADSVVVHEVRLKDGEWDVIFDSERTLPKETVIDLHARNGENYYVFKMADTRKYYEIGEHNLKFSPENEGENPFSRSHEIRHSSIGYFLSSMSAVLLIAGLILTATLFCWVGRTDQSACRLAMVSAPVMILVASALEFAMLLLFGTDATWWCDSDRYGFWGSLLRVVPFAGVAYAQYKCFGLYEFLLFRGECDDIGYPLKLSLKPAAWGMGLFIPILLAGAVIVGSFGINGTVPELVILLVAFCAPCYGIWRTLKANTLTLGKGLGRTVTTFTVIYLLGLLATGFLCVVALFNIVIQIIIAAVIFFGFMAFSDHVVADAERQRREERRRRGY